LRLTNSNIVFHLNTCGYSPSVSSFLTRRLVCRWQLLLVLASAVIVRSESRGTHDYILLSQIRDSPNLEGQVPVFISPKNRVASPRHWVSFSLPPTTRRATVKVFDPASTRDISSLTCLVRARFVAFVIPHRKHRHQRLFCCCVFICCIAVTRLFDDVSACLLCRCLATDDVCLLNYSVISQYLS
jgi:hypothetical protein